MQCFLKAQKIVNMLATLHGYIYTYKIYHVKCNIYPKGCLVLRLMNTQVVEWKKFNIFRPGNQ